MVITQYPIFLARYAYGPMDNLQYILGDPETKTAIFIDPGWEGAALLAHMREVDYTPEAIFLTHGHYDHVQGIPAIVAEYPDLPVYISEKEHPLYTSKIQAPLRPFPENPRVGRIPISVFETPGHSPGSVCFHSGNNLFVGDTVFVDGCGRMDLPGGDPRVLYQSLQLFRTFPSEMQVLPGHSYGGESCTISELLARNSVFLRKTDF